MEIIPIPDSIRFAHAIPNTEPTKQGQNLLLPLVCSIVLNFALIINYLNIRNNRKNDSE
jgi:hypothetical protein